MDMLRQVFYPYKILWQCHKYNLIKIKQYSLSILIALSQFTVHNNVGYLKFTWSCNTKINNLICIQVVSDYCNTPISGTYAHDKH